MGGRVIQALLSIFLYGETLLKYIIERRLNDSTSHG
jgi:hypothetical protein